MRRNMMRFASTLYLTMHHNAQTRKLEADAEGFLYAKGLYKTKIRPEDLPDWYVKGYIYHQDGYISAKGVKYLLFKPNYITCHEHKDDFLFISYNKPIEPDEGDERGIWYHGYDHVISGSIIGAFLTAVKKYSSYDISEIAEEYLRKEKWYRTYYGE